MNSAAKSAAASKRLAVAPGGDDKAFVEPLIAMGEAVEATRRITASGWPCGLTCEFKRG